MMGVQRRGGFREQGRRGSEVGGGVRAAMWVRSRAASRSWPRTSFPRGDSDPRVGEGSGCVLCPVHLKIKGLSQ